MAPSYTQYEPTLTTKQPLDGALQHIFPTKAEETLCQKARRIMGTDVAALADSDLEVYLTEFGYLLDSWLDEYERKVFCSKTLQQLLRDG